jgi:tRNA A-37 threonylcarbamoyl transferase component Bud32
MEYIADTRAVDQFTREWDVEDEASRRATASLVGGLVGRLHESGFANRDLKPRNVIVGRAGDAWIIDLDGVHYKDRVNAETRVRNLQRMVREMREQAGLSVRDRMRFLRSYAQTSGAGTARELFRRLADERGL